MKEDTKHQEKRFNLNEIQQVTFDLISLVRDETHSVLDGENDLRDDFNTLPRLFHYMAQRSQSVSYLLSSGFPWDAEIVLRSFYEANAKIWYLCLTDEQTREARIREFWGLYSAAHDHKRKVKATPLVRNSSFKDRADGHREIFEALFNEQLFSASVANKRNRRQIEQKWSFTEIIKALAEKGDGAVRIPEIDVLLHMYGEQSHLIHADDAALDLMLDRQLRKDDERALLEAAHAARIMSDQASLWVFSLSVLRSMYGREKLLPDAIREKWETHTSLCSQVYSVFFESQKSFYEKYKG